jgi:hypothetical protein
MFISVLPMVCARAPMSLLDNLRTVCRAIRNDPALKEMKEASLRALFNNNREVSFDVLMKAKHFLETGTGGYFFEYATGCIAQMLSSDSGSRVSECVTQLNGVPLSHYLRTRLMHWLRQRGDGGRMMHDLLRDSHEIVIQDDQEPWVALSTSLGQFKGRCMPPRATNGRGRLRPGRVDARAIGMKVTKIATRRLDVRGISNKRCVFSRVPMPDGWRMVHKRITFFRS